MVTTATAADDIVVSKIDFISNDPFELLTNWFESVKNNGNPYLPLRQINAMCIATVHNDKDVLNRNVMLRKYDKNGFYFVTSRKSRKFTNLKHNPAIAATILWIYKINDKEITRQIRINGRAVELPEDKISEIYANEGLVQKVNNRLADLMTNYDWSERSRIVSEILTNYKNGIETFPQPNHFTAFQIIPNTINFLHMATNEIQDGVKYKLYDDGQWIRKR